MESPHLADILEPDGPIACTLGAADPELGVLIARVGRIQLSPSEGPFRELIGSIVAQQLSDKAARTIWTRLVEAVDPTPEAIAQADFDVLRGAGLSRSKATYVQGIARAALTGAVDFEMLDELPDEVVIDLLTQLHGVGRWTAEMFLIFALRRPDILAINDYGIRSAVGGMLDQGRPATPAEVAERSLRWAPHRSAASLWLWGDR